MKSVKDLNLEADFLFAKVMTDEYRCKTVLEKILNIEIKEVKMPEEQKVINILAENKGVRLDIYVNDDRNTVYNIEIQKGIDMNLAKRSRYYQGNIDVNLLKKRMKYHGLRKCFIIFICTTFDPFKQGRHLYTFENRCNEDKELALGNQATKVFLTTRGIADDVDQKMLEFLTYIKNSTDEMANESKSHLVHEINKKVKLIKEDKRTEVEYMTLIERDEQNIEKGMQKGIQKGRQEEKLENAKAFLDFADDETIAVRLGLEIEVVKQLRVEAEQEI